MVIVVGHWDIGYHAPVTEQYYWNLALRDFGVNQWWMNPVSGIVNSEQINVQLKERNDYQDIFEELDANIKRVFVEPINPRQGVNESDIIWLHNFKHPENCIYVFGSAHHNPTFLKREEDVIVTIKTEKDNGVLWGDQCMTIVLYDRLQEKLGIKWR